MTVLVFPGQGSQCVGMGRQLFDRYHRLEQEVSDFLGYSLKDLCLNGPEQQLHQTQYTQVALYVVSAMSYMAYQEENSNSPVAVLGHSLGEYNALFAAQAFSFMQGVRLVQKRGVLMSQMQEGKMAAVMGVKLSALRQILCEHAPLVDVANINAPDQIVVAGPQQALLSLLAVLKSQGTRCILLRVSGAFHSRYMLRAQQQFSDFLKHIPFSSLQIPVIANCTADWYQDDQIADCLLHQLTRSVRWVESIERLLKQGHEHFEEIGPGHVLTKLIKRIKVGVNLSS